MNASEPQRDDQNVFQAIFEDHWEGFKKLYPSYECAQYEEPVQKMLGCGKEAGGYSEYRCPHCGGGVRRVAFTCKSCFCLSCAQPYVDNFVSRVSEILHPGVVYRHVILTIPEQLRKTFYSLRHDGSFLSAFIGCGYKCLEDVVSTVKRQSLKIGTIVVLQTHGRSGQYNPHLHIIMTDGGVNEEEEKWVELGYFRYEMIHTKWQYHLFQMLKREVATEGIKQLIDELYKAYPQGLVANVQKGRVPESCKGLARYLAKYVASPPIAVKRIVKYDGQTVTYYYQDHKTQGRQYETVDVMTFIGRMVEHILPKWFQRVRYYGIQATKTFQKWFQVIQAGWSRIGRLVSGTYQIVARKDYRTRYQEASGRDPLRCSYCGSELVLWQVWHPSYGSIYDEYENIKRGKYEQAQGVEGGGGPPLRPSTGILQLSLFELPV